LKKARRLSLTCALLAAAASITFGINNLRAQQQNQPPAQANPPAQQQDAPKASSPQATPAPQTPPGAQTQPAPTTEPTKQTQPTAPTKSAAQAQKDDRIFFALPNLLTVEKGNSRQPLTTKQKFKTVAQGCFDPVEVVFIGVQAGIGQADNTDPTYHQGFVGYARRFGTDYADSIIGNFGTGAIFPTLLHQDPRYYQMGSGNFFHRFGYAAGRVIVTRSDRTEKYQFNFSELLGNSMAAGLSNLYHPRPHTIASTADVLGTQVLIDALGYELKEFWPDMRRGLVRNRH
jgi:hypothetical protein